MEKIAGDITSLLQETLSLYQDLKSVLVTEKSHIEKMDVKNLWATTDKKKRLAASIEDVLSRILSLAGRHTAHMEMTVKNFSVREIVSALPLELKVKSGLKLLGGQIEGCKKEIILLAYENKRFIIEYLTVIDGIFSTIRQNPGQNQYSHSGQVYSSGQETRLFSAEV